MFMANIRYVFWKAGWWSQQEPKTLSLRISLKNSPFFARWCQRKKSAAACCVAACSCAACCDAACCVVACCDAACSCAAWCVAAFCVAACMLCCIGSLWNSRRLKNLERGRNIKKFFLSIGRRILEGKTRSREVKKIIQKYFQTLSFSLSLDFFFCKVRCLCKVNREERGKNILLSKNHWLRVELIEKLRKRERWV